MRHLLQDLPLELLSQDEFQLSPPEESGDTLAENAVQKATYVSEQTGLPAIADDSGLFVDALQGLPGVHSARYAGKQATDAANRRKLLEELDDVPEDQRQASFRCVIALVSVGEGLIWTTEGRCDGLIVDKETGLYGFGYDPIFYYPPLEQTFAELSPEIKNRVSHRGRAMRSLKRYLSARLEN